MDLSESRIEKVERLIDAQDDPKSRAASMVLLRIVQTLNTEIELSKAGPS